MKTLKITAFALFMAATNLVCAQEFEGKSAVEKAKIETQELKEKLNLTPDQEKVVSAAALTRAKQIEADREKYKGDREGMKTARKQNNETFESSLKGVLTPEQKTKYEQTLKERFEKRANGEKPLNQ